MKDALVLREAVREDVSTILGLICELASFEKLSHQVVATEEILLKTLFGERPVAEVLIAEVAGEAVGFALYFYSFSTFLGRPGIYLEDLYVKPPFRKKGIGKRFLHELARRAVERECGRVEWAVLDWNRSAIGFYESLGARPMSDWITYRLTGDELERVAQEDAFTENGE
ncbi:MAG: GNAT family N-acetyltransferase [Bdellovibrionales bacterium]|nr:GNAT family N-acetyltransferase [Bdellovibrionales bacterium]